MFSRFTILDKEIEDFFSNSKDPFEKLKEIEGIVYRQTANRATKKFLFNNKEYFFKYHGPIGYKEVLKNIFKFQLPTVSARPEWNALLRSKELGIYTPEPLAICEKGFNPANSESFIITKSIEPNISLEEVFESNIADEISVLQKKTFIKRVASICRELHLGGMNHRDLYLCHFLVDAKLDPKKPIYLIDLHRAQIRKKITERWLIKDIGGLYHSAIKFGITERDCYRFLMTYFNCSLRDLFSNQQTFMDKTRGRAFSMYMKPILSEIDISSEKDLHDQSDYIKEIKQNERWIGLKDYFNQDILKIIKNEKALISQGELIKNEEGHLVVKLHMSDEKFVIKKYRIKNLFHMTKRIFKKTRARNSWETLHWLNSVGVKTMQPVLIYEELGLIGATNSVLVSKEIEGKRLDLQVQEKEEPLIIASNLYNFFKRMYWISFHHGDAKSSNFFINKNKLVVFDLDSSKRNKFKKLLIKNIEKDKKRILKSLKNSLPITKALKLRFKAK
tara:strand:+ start:2237 stop:3745 length:1509 start_codon:yes stop_codon:yes gene_type:complete